MDAFHSFLGAGWDFARGYFRWLLAGFLAGLVFSCATPPRPKPELRKVGIYFRDDVKLDHDQMIVCIYVHEKSTVVCMTPEEYEVRLHSQDL